MTMMDSLLNNGHNAPDYSITVDSIDKSGGIKKRLMSLTLTDNRGFEADQLDVELDDSDEISAATSRGENSGCAGLARVGAN